MNLSVDIEENVSLNYCLKKFSKKGLLNVDLSQIQRKREDLEQRIKQLIERP